MNTATNYSDDGITCEHCGQDMSRAVYGEHREACGAAKAKKQAQLAKRRAYARGRSEAMKSVGMRRTRYGWE